MAAGRRETRPPDRTGRPRTAVALWAGLIAVSVAAGFVLRGVGWISLDHLPPLYAHARRPSWGLVPVAALAAGLVVVAPRVAARCPWRVLLPVAWAGAVGWAVALAASDGWDAVAYPLTHATEYLAGLPAMGDDPLRWLRGFTEALPTYPTHVKGHPPLPMLLLWALDRVGLHGPGWAAAFIIAAGASAAVAIATTLRRLAGQEAARRALPFLVLAPYAVWIATSMDALFLGVGAWGTALLAAACTDARRPWVNALVAGLLIGMLPYLSYGLLPLLAVPVAVMIVRRPSRPVVVALVAGLAVVPCAFTAAGFWWFDGVAATAAAWSDGAGSDRPYPYFLVGNLATLALLTGPATAAALARIHAVRRADSVTVLVCSALLGAAALDLAGVTRGEVERIWLPYAAWVTAATASHRRGTCGMLAAQVATTVAIQAFVRSPW